MNPRDESLATRMYPEEKPPAVNAAPAKCTISERMYPTKSGTEAALHAPAEADSPEQRSVDDLVNEVESLAGRMYGNQTTVETAVYDAKALNQAFNGLQQHYREMESQHDVAALAEGRAQTAVLLAEMAVPVEVAHDISSGLSTWHGREPLDDMQVAEYRSKTETTLKAEWGPKYEANIKLAQAAGAEAMKRLPWLRDLFETGAGNDPKIIRHFARIGLKNARRAKR